jgi:hypothetical protein
MIGTCLPDFVLTTVAGTPFASIQEMLEARAADLDACGHIEIKIAEIKKSLTIKTTSAWYSV